MAKRIFSLLLCIALLAGVMSFLSSCNIQTVGRTYYISSSTGNDDNDARTEGSAWKTLKNLKSTILQEGDRILLKRGDEWNERLEIYGGGSEEHKALVSSYGNKSDPKPIIRLNNGLDDICLLYSDLRYDPQQKNMANEMGNIIIEELDLRNAFLGIYIRNIFYGAENLVIRNVDISEIWCDEAESKYTWAGGGPAMVEYYGKMVKGNLPKVNKNTGVVTENGGGAYEWALSSAVLTNGGWKGVEFGNIILNNAGPIQCVAFEDVYIHDVTVAGGAVFKTEHCIDVTIERCRSLEGGKKYSFYGGTTGSYVGTTNNLIAKNIEISYIYNHGENDGCAIDYETQCWNLAVKDSVFHHNDSGSLLIMALPDYAVHENVSFDHNLCYANIRNPKSGIYNWEILMSNVGENNLSISYNDFFTRTRTKWGPVLYIGCNEAPFSPTTTKIDNNESRLEDYRTRFSFNKDGFGEGFTAHTGTFTVANGVGKLTAEGKNGAIFLNNPVNGFCYKEVLINVANNAKGSVQIQYALADGTVKKSQKVDIKGAGAYIIDLGEDIYSAIYDIVVIFTASQSGATLEMDFIQFLVDIEASAKKSGENTIDITFTGESTPFVENDPVVNSIALAGYTVKAIEKINYNTVRVTVNEKVGNVKNLTLAARADLFVTYFEDIIKGLDSDRTAADDAALLGCEVQSYYYNGSITLTCK